MIEILARLLLAIALLIAAATAPRGAPLPRPTAAPVDVSGVSASADVATLLGAPSAKPSESRIGPVATTTAGPRPRATSLPVARTAAPAKPRPTARISAKPIATHRAQIGGQLRGLASWYCRPGRSACTRGYPPDDCRAPTWGCYAAAGPAVRATLGPNWQGRQVRVAGRADVVVTLIDWCACPNGRVLDLYASVYAQLGSLSSGLLDVTVEVVR